MTTLLITYFVGTALVWRIFESEKMGYDSTDLLAWPIWLAIDLFTLLFAKLKGLRQKDS